MQAVSLPTKIRIWCSYVEELAAWRLLVVSPPKVFGAAGSLGPCLHRHAQYQKWLACNPMNIGELCLSQFFCGGRGALPHVVRSDCD